MCLFCYSVYSLDMQRRHYHLQQTTCALQPDNRYLLGSGSSAIKLVKIQQNENCSYYFSFTRNLFMYVSIDLFISALGEIPPNGYFLSSSFLLPYDLIKYFLSPFLPFQFFIIIFFCSESSDFFLCHLFIGYGERRGRSGIFRMKVSVFGRLVMVLMAVRKLLY